MVVRLNKTQPRPPPHEPCIVPLIDIDPSRVSILHEGAYMYMMRMSGVDTMPT